MIVENFKTVQLGFEFCIRNYFAFTTSKSTIIGTGQLVCTYPGTFLLGPPQSTAQQPTFVFSTYISFLTVQLKSCVCHNFPTTFVLLLSLSNLLVILTSRSTSCFHCSFNSILKSSIQSCRNMSHVRGHTLFHTVRQ